MFRNALHLSLATAFIYLCCKNTIAQEEEDKAAKQPNNETDLISPMLENITNWLVETCSTYNTSNEPTHHRVRNMTIEAMSGFDFSEADNNTVYLEEIPRGIYRRFHTIKPMARGLLHGLIDAYADYTTGDVKKTAQDFVSPCNCTVLLTIGQLGNITTDETKEITRECGGKEFATLG